MLQRTHRLRKDVGEAASPEESKREDSLRCMLDNANTWDLLAPALVNRLGIYIIAIDLPGHGKSEPLPPNQLYYPWEFAGTLLDVSEALGWREFNILSHSRGAHISLLFSGCFPDRVYRLIAIESIGLVNHFKDDAKVLASFLTKRREMNLAETSAAKMLSIEVSENLTSEQRDAINHRGKSTFATIEEAARARMKGETPLSFNAAMRLCERGLVKIKLTADTNSKPVKTIPRDIPTLISQISTSLSESTTDVFTWSTDKRLMIKTFVRWEDAAFTKIISQSQAHILMIFGEESVLWGLGTLGRRSDVFRNA
ncbi:Alpha/Beta hydrolase protein [Chytridium lagenaria]|nr:Alpha/Beta hydrolase protein [Chytridium lagenaria]